VNDALWVAAFAVWALAASVTVSILGRLGKQSVRQVLIVWLVIGASMLAARMHLVPTR